MKLSRFLLLMGLFFFVISCDNSKQSSKNRGEIFKVDLRKKVNPFEEIFSKAEIIPLETTDNSLVVYIGKIYSWKDKFFVYDYMAQKLLVFAQDGRFQYRIGKHGQGAGEYLSMYDCFVDTIKNEALFMSVYGHINVYDLEGNFKEKLVLPGRPNYYSVIPLTDGVIATWSHMRLREGDGILVYDRNSGDTINSYWSDNPDFDAICGEPFYRYDNKSYFSVSLRQQVYEIRADGMYPVYYWDFGKDNIRDSRLDYYSEIEAENGKNRIILYDIGSNELPYIMMNQSQNKDYCYVPLRRKIGTRPPITHVFYNKKEEKGYVFDFLTEGYSMHHPLYFGDEYLITDIVYEDREKFKSILTEEEYRKLENMLEDDNPCLLKLYFKK